MNSDIYEEESDHGDSLMFGGNNEVSKSRANGCTSDVEELIVLERSNDSDEQSYDENEAGRRAADDYGGKV